MVMGMTGTARDNAMKARRLLAIAAELQSLALALNPGSEDEAECCVSPVPTQAFSEPASPDADLAELARIAYRDRRRREEIFKIEGLFSEPAWDILLDLFVAANERRSISVMSACIASTVPATTALRWITALEQQGILERKGDPKDARRTFVRLSPQGFQLMSDYLSGSGKPTKAKAVTAA